MGVPSDKSKVRDKQFLLRLFVAGEEPHSLKAKENLRRFCASYPDMVFDIEVVDVLTSFQTAFENKIFLTPAMQKITPSPAITFFGDLSSTAELSRVLGLEEDV